MVAPHYAYNAIKIPGPGGIITVRGDPDLAVECEAAGSRMADAVIAELSAEAAQLLTDANDGTFLKRPNLNGSELTTSDLVADAQRVDPTRDAPRVESNIQAANGPSLPMA